MIPSRLTLEQVDRGVFKRLRETIVAFGYYADEKSFTEAQVADENAAIVASGKKLIYCHPHGTYEGKGEVKQSEFVINRREVNGAPIGVGSGYTFEPKQKEVISNNEVVKKKFFDKYRNPSGLYDIMYDIRYVTNDVKYERIMEQILLSAFGRVKYVKGMDESYNDTEQGFEFLRGAFIDVSMLRYIEKGYLYRANNVNLEGGEKVGGDIAAITEVITTVVPVKDEDITSEHIDSHFDEQADAL